MSGAAPVRRRALVTGAASGIGKLTDLPGKRVAVIPTTTTERAIHDVVRKLSLQNVTLLSVKDHAEGLAALDAGKIDVGRYRSYCAIFAELRQETAAVGPERS